MNIEHQLKAVFGLELKYAVYYTGVIYVKQA